MAVCPVNVGLAAFWEACLVTCPRAAWPQGQALSDLRFWKGWVGDSPADSTTQPFQEQEETVAGGAACRGARQLCATFHQVLVPVYFFLSSCPAVLRVVQEEDFTYLRLCPLWGPSRREESRLTGGAWDKSISLYFKYKGCQGTSQRISEAPAASGKAEGMVGHTGSPRGTGVWGHTDIPPA